MIPARVHLNMRTPPKFFLAAACGALFCGQALAQATVDPRALQPLQPRASEAPSGNSVRPATPTERKPPVKALAKPVPTKPVPTKPVPAKPVPSKPVLPKPPLVVPPTPPAVPAVPPPIAVPVRPVPPPSPVPVVTNAPGVAAVIAGGQRITFGETGSDLNAATEAAIRATVHSAPPGPNTTFTISAFAAGTPEDASTSRRLSLSRALAVRSVLIAEGIPSVRIYVKALGTTTPAFADGPADRVDIVVTAPEATPAPVTPAPATAASPASAPPASTVSPASPAPPASPVPANLTGPTRR